MLCRFLVPFLLVAGPGLTDLPLAVDDGQFTAVALPEAELGQLLFYDPILSGNRAISCATCHHPRFGTSDGLSLGMGEGGIGLGPNRRPDPANPPEQRIPRNAPALFNLGAQDFTVLFHDGRIEVDPTRPGGLRTPLAADMTLGFSGILSAQTMFPVLSQDEMAGHVQENEIARAARQGLITGPGGAWDLIAQRVAAIPAYQARFEAVYPEIAAGRPIAFTDISNAIAGFMGFEWRSDDSPFDAVLRGEAALEGAAADGQALFYGAGGCSTCHSGPFQTDHDFHAMGVPQIGPGKAARFESHSRDEGRLRVTGLAEDAFKFRTPSLRNVRLTGPYGHSGAYADLTEFVTAHADPRRASEAYDRSQAVLVGPSFASDWRILDDPAEIAQIVAATSPDRIDLSPTEIAALVAFLDSLTGATALTGRLGVPETVPSGLPVDQ
ncbi:cytochrome-c peroxidase [Pseudoruegeria sp. SK021]|uniref:cytochrome-c peroxidase n=1 Tax=Pseudoruegeria sp. SK021 TaxID=1933035 RepID=UPI000A250599|nr:cytochrome-c peroxidase [Pseudoruegeria sp. SK021]OSP54804.1 cytochrome-c peroxidase [Pseudoruegeria sp. SK021]